jgi:hypothetical protein
MSPLPLILSNVVLLFFIDLAKAFDTVDNSILVGQIWSIGVSEGSLAWFVNYLSQRVQCIKSENLLSQPLPVTKVVPQGSILGPTLFSIYISNIAQAVGSSLIHLYADDTVLYSAGPSLECPNKLSLPLKLF